MLRDTASFLATNLAEVLMLSVGLRSRLDEVVEQVRQPGMLARELLLLALGVPLLSLVVIRVLSISDPASALFVLFAICPAAPYILRGYQGRRSAACKALAVVAVGLAASVITIPSWIWILNRYFGFNFLISVQEVAVILLLKVFLPLSVGVAIRRFSGRAADAVGRVVAVLVLISLVGTTVLMLKVGLASLPQFTFRVVFGLLIISIGSAVLGEFAGGRDPELREILGRAAMNGNPAIALAVIGPSYPSLQVGGLVAAYLIWRAIAEILYQLLKKVERVKKLLAA